MLKRLALALAVLLAFTPVAVAAEVGTPAWLNKGQLLYQGPGTAYDVVGELGDEVRIRVDRCTYRWCLIHAKGERGWASRANISYGRYPRSPLEIPKLGFGRGAVVCLYEGRHFSGDRVCSKPGTVVRDLLLFDADNRISSVEVNGGSVTLCRDRDFSSYCERIVEDQPVIHGFLDNNVTSYRVW